MNQLEPESRAVRSSAEVRAEAVSSLSGRDRMAEARKLGRFKAQEVKGD